MSLFGRFRSQIETSDQNKDASLKTHYYKGNFNKIFESVEKVFHEDADCRILTVSKEHGEIAVEIKKPFPCFLIVTIVSVKALETAVDFNISTERFSILGNYPELKKRVVSYYDRVNQLHTVIKEKQNS
ncbi:MAG TPA: hypothetical protein VK190_01160 [Pseudoneobacillus sp.]|uniref:hypothetical protein n=1 Tax=Neobacillus sp. PS2-9 TaxID=3070676 RepID=UPI0027E0E194|nr:hypothetical protein [Neobacillus sp. PS2-9]WML59503.1 hypothetical protein RCG25_06955 [Neobacillus sp. PS2-9]HLO10844.1 hypothetical protein [Pseudoneobacillus sp.]